MKRSKAAVVSVLPRWMRPAYLGLLIGSLLLQIAIGTLPVNSQSEDRIPDTPQAQVSPPVRPVPASDNASGADPEAETPTEAAPPASAPDTGEQLPADSATPAASDGITEVIPLAEPDTEAPVVKAAPAGQYVLEFNRSPVVENRLRFEGIYDEARLYFTRPRDWQAQSIKVLLRYRHSAALYATRSNMTVLVNGTSIGSVPLNRKQGELGEAIFEVPARLIQDYNELVVAALQNNSPTCTQDPFDPSLWSEVLPDSKLVFDYEPQSVPLDFRQYPYPIVDVLSLEPNQVAYLKPTEVEETWLTAASRLQSSLGRIVEYRPLDTRLIEQLAELEADEQLVIIGTPETQPALAELSLPIATEENQFLDGDGQPLAPDVGVLALTTAFEDQVPVLVVTGNGPEGIAKAVQFLVQNRDQAIATGRAILVTQIAEVPSPEPRNWPDYLPVEDTFQLQELKTFSDQTFEDVTVWGSQAPALEFDFHALPDDQFLPGGFMQLSYSYGPQINPLTSQVEIKIDDLAIGGERLRSEDGGMRETIQIDLPPDLIKPHSKMQINFRLDPRERRSCSRVTDQQLWGTIHADTEFTLVREVAAWLPDLKLLQYGFPFTAPQDLSQTAIAVPETPTNGDLRLLLEVSERLGRLSDAQSVNQAVYRIPQVTEAIRASHHLIGIGIQADFPFPEALAQSSLRLGDAFSRRWQQTQIQALPDNEGVVKQVRSPWNPDRMVLALSGQTESGLEHLRHLFDQDSLFFQLEGDTVLVNALDPALDAPNTDADAYSLTVLRESRQQRTSQERRPRQLLLRLQRHWLFLSAGTVAAALVFYGIAQQILKRMARYKA